RDRDRHNKRYYQDRPRRSRSRERDRRRSRSRSPQRLRDQRDHDREKSRRDDNRERDRKPVHPPTEKQDQPEKPAVVPTTDSSSKVRVIQKNDENFYDFDVEIERSVKKDFYAKRTVGQAFDDSLQRYLVRKGTIQPLTYK